MREDNIPGEFWKVLGEKGINELVRLCKEMYMQGVWLEDFTKVIMIPLQKKVNAVECGDHRTVILISHASKILLKVLTKGIEALLVGISLVLEEGAVRGTQSE